MTHAAKPTPLRRIGALAVALATLCVMPAGVANAVGPTPSAPAATADAQQEYLKLTIERTDKNGDTVEVGDTLTYIIGYENVSTQNIAVYPRTSNLDGVTTPQGNTKFPICRWSTLKPGEKAACSNTANPKLAYHVVTEADVANGFTPEASIDATTDSTGSKVLQSVKITGQKVNVAQPVALPADIAAWKARNEQLADYKTLSEKLSKTDGINWLFIGDSITQGVLYTRGYRIYSELFANQLETEKVRGVSRADDLVMNTGISSADASWPLKSGAFDKWVTEKHPNVVFITFGMNDGRSHQFPVDQYIANLTSIIDKVRELGAIPILQTQNYTTDATFNTNLDTYFDAERRLAIKKDVILVDFNKRWLELNNGNKQGNTYMGTGNNIHPGENGHIEWAKFTLGALNMLSDSDAIAKWNSADMALAGPSVAASADAVGLKGTAGLGDALPSGAATADVGKYLTGAQYIDAGEDVVKAVAGKQQSNVTIRFRAAGGGSEPQTLFSLGDSGSTTRATVRLSATGQLQFQNSDGTGDFYTVGAANLADGNWHTVSVNFADNSFTAYADGALLRTVSGNASIKLNVPAAITVNQATVGAVRGSDAAAGKQQLTGVVDYVTAWGRNLSEAEAKKITAETPVAEVAVAKNQAATDALKPLISNTGVRKNIVFAGGETIEGGYSDHIIAKNLVQLLDERVRWEYATSLGGNDTELQRAKFFVAAAQGGVTAKQLDEEYDARIGQYKPDILFVAPDLYDADGKLVETDAAAFATHVKSVADKATAAGSKVVLVTPVTVRGGEEAYAKAMRGVADEAGLPLLDAQAWIGQVVAANPAVRTGWFNAAGQLNYSGHLGYARFMMKSLDLYPANVSQSRVASLPYDTIGVNLAGASENGGEVPVARVDGGADDGSADGARAHIDTTRIDPAASLVIVKDYRVVEVAADGTRTTVANGLAPADVLKNGIDVPLAAGDTAAHTYEVIGSAVVPDGSQPVTVTYTATLPAVEPGPGPDPGPGAVTIDHITAVTTQTGVKVGDRFDRGKVIVTATLTDGKKRALAADEYALTAVDEQGKTVDLSQPFVKAGKVTVTASVANGDAAAFTARFAISVTARPGTGGGTGSGAGTGSGSGAGQGAGSGTGSEAGRKPGAGDGSGSGLSKTGADVAAVTAAAGLLMLAGVAAAVARGRRRSVRP
ncbi:GDSL-type esterase/lipase family protein [Bifidobacterium leontopitheci]|uniref:GDSL-like protein n=1 Tax=Bifidobacterium leontopitheci TaxID=2650774 RepID=A0A6I1GKB8_9BIFI|nr:GDSL-type esterase/lipase family protein [Bifidobacterium leontopitheci]KAB7789817.1 GDSL-like protein [Bifidobacterium leontopitheci]